MSEQSQQPDPLLSARLPSLLKPEQQVKSDQQIKPEELPQDPAPHAHKFRVALALLCGIAFVAIAIALAVAVHDSSGGSDSASAVAWSTWAPDVSGSSGAREIADHVAPYYRLNGSQQLNVITPISVSQSTAAGTTTGSGMTVAVDTAPSGKSQSLSLLNGKTIAYNICGLGPADCELPGTPSTARMLLMRRQALELALYTLKYISDSENVLIVLPPSRTTKAASGAAKGTHVTVAVLFDRKELQPWLNEPLSRTLASYPLESSELTPWSKTQEATLVDELTASALFSSQIESQQEGGRLLVLAQLPTQ